MSTRALLTNLRIILRHLKKLPSDGTNAFRARTLAQVRANMTNSNKEEVRELRWKAQDAAQLVTALKVRKELLDLHAGEKMTQEERVKLTAHRVGLNVPKVYDADKAAAEAASEDDKRRGAAVETLERMAT